MPTIVLRSRRPYFPPLCFLAYVTWQAFLCSRHLSRFFSLSVIDGGMRRGADSTETYADAETPKSTPQPGLPFQVAGLAPVWTPKEMCQPLPSREIVTLRIVPPMARETRNRSYPSFGTRTSAHVRLSLRTSTACPGNGMDRRWPRFFCAGNFAGWSGFQKLSYAASRWRRIC